MIKLDDYVIVLKILERDIKPIDAVTAFNLAREFSAIYLKLVYAQQNDATINATIGRLSSMIVYINKALPDNTGILIEFITLIIDDMKTALSLPT